MTNKSVASIEVQTEYNTGFRQCKGCGTHFSRVQGCSMITCPVCRRSACFYCGVQLLSHSEIATHVCRRDSLLEWAIQQRTKTLSPLQQQAPNAIQVFIAAISGSQLTIVTTPNETLADFKKKVAERTGIPVLQQTLTYCGKILNGTGVISTFGIRNGSTIVMAAQVVGGGR
jgi:hypothetical protein